LHECARTHIDVSAVGVRFAIGKQCCRLIAIDNGKRDALTVHHDMTKVVARWHARRQCRPGNGKQMQETLVPVQGFNIPQERARGIRGIGHQTVFGT
jgi:hypothetical protein